MKTDKNWINHAAEVLVQSGIVDEHGIFPKAFKGYISSFAAMIVQSGLLPAIVTYESTDSQAEAMRYLIPKAIVQLLCTQEAIPQEWHDKLLSDYYTTLLNDPSALTVFGRQVEQAIVSLKLALRMYKKGDTLIKKEQRDIGIGNKSKGVETGSKPECIEIETYDNKRNKTRQNVSSNIGWLYYREYYRDYEKNYKHKVQYHYKINGSKLSQKPRQSNRQELILQYVRNPYLLNSQLASMLENNKRVQQALSKGFASLTFVTQYPGLLIGMGLSHGTPIKNDLKCGFQFDHTTGLPVIPGSSVKGVLRSYFPKFTGMDKDGAYNNQRCKYIRSLLALQDEKAKDLSDEDIIVLTRQIFDPSWGIGDIFMDAIITGGLKGRFMSDDYLAPHKNLYKDPVPIQFIKILPGVEFTFFFRVAPVTIGKVQINKLALFRNILEDVGIGAKTNVGYGRLEYKD